VEFRKVSLGLRRRSLRSHLWRKAGSADVRLSASSSPVYFVWPLQCGRELHVARTAEGGGCERVGICPSRIPHHREDRSKATTRRLPSDCREWTDEAERPVRLLSRDRRRQSDGRNEESR